MTNLNNSTGNFSKVKTFDILMQSMKKTVTEVETSANAMSEMFDSVKTGISHDLQQVKGKNEQLDSKLSSSISGSRRIKNPKTQSLTDLRRRVDIYRNSRENSKVWRMCREFTRSSEKKTSLFWWHIFRESTQAGKILRVQWIPRNIVVKQRLQDKFIQKWTSDISQSSKSTLYRTFKTTLV